MSGAKLIVRYNRMVIGRTTKYEDMELRAIECALNKQYIKIVGDIHGAYTWDARGTLIDLLLGRITLGMAVGNMVLSHPMFKRVTPSPRQQKELAVKIKEWERSHREKWSAAHGTFIL